MSFEYSDLEVAHEKNIDDKKNMRNVFVNDDKNILVSFLFTLRKKGHETYVFLIAPRIDTNSVKFVWNLDPIGAAKTYDEAKNGLKFVCYGCNLDINGIEISKRIRIEF